MPAAIEIIELGFGHRVVNVESGNEKLAKLLKLVEAMNACRGLSETPRHSLTIS